jgi:hypothetical protein
VVTRRLFGARRALFLAVLAAIAAVSASAGTSSGGPAPDLAAVRNCGSTSTVPQPAGRYRYVILQAWDYRRISAVKRQNPGAQVLVYKDMAATRDDAHRADMLPTGVGYDYANRHHPEWFLKDTNGRRVAWASWPHSWQMDVGSRSYQRAWARNVARDLRRRGWDGVFVDGIARTMQYPWYLNGRVLAKYPGPNDYQRATTSFLRRVGPALKRRGRLVVGNINDAPPGPWRRWVGYLSGTSKEWWTKSDKGRGTGMLTGDEWAYQMRLLSRAQALHKIFIAIAYGPADDAPAMDYARASFLLFAGGRRSALTFSTGCGAEPAAPNWRADVGAPVGGASAVGPVWRRKFTGGIVVVNSSSSASPAIALGGSYVKPDGSIVASVALQPHTGLVLRRR